MIVPLIKEVNFFKSRNIQGQDLVQVCSELKHEYLAKGEAVFKYGDFGHKFYVVLTGEVAVKIPDPKNKQQHAVIQNQTTRRQSEVVKFGEDKRTVNRKSSHMVEQLTFMTAERLSSIQSIKDQAKRRNTHNVAANKHALFPKSKVSLDNNHLPAMSIDEAEEEESEKESV